MGIGIIALIIVVIAFLLINSMIKLSLKLIGIGVLIVISVFTIYICLTQPKMHKPFSLNTIEYLLKINKDGSMTTTKQVTHTVLKGVEE